MPVKLEACASRVFFSQQFQRENSRGRERKREIHFVVRICERTIKRFFLINIVSLEFLNYLPTFEFKKIFYLIF